MVMSKLTCIGTSSNNVNRNRILTVKIKVSRQCCSTSDFWVFLSSSCHTFPPPPSCFRTTISLDNHKPLLTAEEIYGYETTVPIGPLCCVLIYIPSNHAQPASVLCSWRQQKLHKPAIRLISTVDRELRKKAATLVCLCVLSLSLCAYVRAKTPTFDKECVIGTIASPPEGPVKRVSVESVRSHFY